MEEPNVLFVIEDREYTAEDAQNKIQNADKHIKTIEEENADLRKKVDEYMEALAKTQDVKPEPAKPANTEPTNQGISEEDIAKLIETQIQKRESQSTAETNLKTVKETMLTVFGTEGNANEEFGKKASEMGLTTEEAIELAKRSPKVVLSWFGDVGKSTQNYSASNRNTQSVASTTSQVKEGTWAWWQQMRKDNPKAYFSPQNARKRMVDAERLGKEGFFGKN